MNYRLLVAVLSFVALALSVEIVSAHVVVKPSQVNVATFQTFSIGVPNEKDIAVTGLRLTIPSGLKDVTPTVKPGWTISTKTSGDDITEIDWTGGTVPAGLRDDFSFSAQAPDNTTTLNWKAYQTYADNTIVAWDQDPSSIPSGQEGTPYSKTVVVNDLAATPLTPWVNRPTTHWLTALVGIIAVGAFLLALRRR